MTALVLGPLLRHVGERTATVWVETDRPCRVLVRAGDVEAEARTFTVHGHHFGLVEVEGLEPGARVPYEVRLDDVRVWPEDDSAFPPSRLRTLDFSGTLRVSFGSCRRSPDRDDAHGFDTLSALAHHLVRTDAGWPDVLLMVGDQVYADELDPAMREIVREHRGGDEGVTPQSGESGGDATSDHADSSGACPDDEVADFEEYTHLYRLAWREDPAVRWLLSTVPTFTVFDDHDIRDDWNTSYTWRQQMWDLPWWRNRIVGGISSYWVYQHLGNLSPEARATDKVLAAVRETSASGGDSGDVLDEFAERADRQPDTARWSYAHDWGRTRLVVVDSRCSRLLTPERRGMLDDEEFDWLDGQLQGDVDHLLVASSLPYLLAPAVHHAESWNEAVAEGAWGARAARLGEKVRQAADLEHWAAFERSFREVANDVIAVARGERGAAPATVAFLSGDVHFSYLARVLAPEASSAIVQVVCSPLRNPLPSKFQWANRLACVRGTGVPFRWLARMARVPRSPLRWRITEGPWFDNAIATVELTGRESRVQWRSPTAPNELSEVAAVPLTR
ncbi:alkaline phosphatase family protein [Actinomadura logoneensis]|uniref:Alkaline phosphatase family protein n=1 Tax=Actinomadura logoneensis TaxID=2293572 RepID=A0A372JME6_9ACTN|nr:alkaline phosphatase D family protein [Actinomadura logoneensis]RFU41177.1 alkaline phosphatase family protein [Actinomadura logoneensis]